MIRKRSQRAKQDSLGMIRNISIELDHISSGIDLAFTTSKKFQIP